MLCSYDDVCYIICNVLRGRYCVIQHSCSNTNKPLKTNKQGTTSIDRIKSENETANKQKLSYRCDGARFFLVNSNRENTIIDANTGFFVVYYDVTVP